MWNSFGCQSVVPMCNESDLTKPGCYNVNNNKYTEDLYHLHHSILKLERIEYILLIIIIADLIAKLYNDKMVKEDI